MWKWLCTPHHPNPHRNSMSAISHLLLIRFCSNFKGRFLWASRTDSNCYGDICPGNICPRDVCPYQEYLRTWFWPKFKGTFLGSAPTTTKQTYKYTVCRVWKKNWAEILRIWTNVIRAYVAWTNVTITVWLCSRWSQEPKFKVWSKLGQ